MSAKIPPNSHPDQLLSEVLIPQAELQARVQALGAQLSADYAHKNPLLVCILRGGIMFLTDLMRAMPIPHTLDFMAVSSYGIGARVSTRQVRIVMDLNTDISDRHVLLIEDIIDTGHTLTSVLALLNSRNPASLKVCTLLDKHERREVPIQADYIGFQIPDKFVVGYGLDIDEYWRNLPYIGVVKPEVG